MFFSNENNNSRKNYQKFLEMIGSLSNLFSDSQIPLLYYRAHENAFCEAFHAENISASDMSVDAKKSSIGIGLKTFRAGNNKTLQKIAEFNSAAPNLKGLQPLQLAKNISEIRNQRINLTEQMYSLNITIYHCVVGGKGTFKICEEPLKKINIKNIKIIENKKSTLS